MNKRARLVVLLAVLAVCFAFLWPSLSWYYGTSQETKDLALSSLENIRDYSRSKAEEDEKAIEAMVKADNNAVLGPEYAYLQKAAYKNYKKVNAKGYSKSYKEMTALDVLKGFANSSAVIDEIATTYRESILKAKNYYQNSVKLGLDLSGGMNIIIKADLDAAAKSQKAAIESTDVESFKKEAMEQAIETLTGRIDKFGLTEPVIRQQGEDRIYVEMPGAAEADAINTIIMGKGILNFRLVDSDATQKFNQYFLSKNGVRSLVFDESGNLLDPSIIPSDCEVLGQYVKDEYGIDERTGYLVVKKEIALDGSHIKSATVGAGGVTGEPEVDFVLDTEGADIFGKFTGAHKGEFLAIVSDNKIKSNARINDAILGGRVAITGFGVDEANNLQKVLQTAWLNVPLSVESQQVIGATLGQQAVQQALKAILLGLVLIFIFMLGWYKGCGINAIVAQILNFYIMFAVLSAFNLTLSLPSIAGMILTIGMAVDANVVIFERIKEEVLNGKSREAAISAGFDNAFWAIMDSNITTFIAAIFLSQLGSGSIQGFAVSLAIGVVSSVFTALFVSRLMFDFDTEVLHSKKVSIGWGVK